MPAATIHDTPHAVDDRRRVAAAPTEQNEYRDVGGDGMGSHMPQIIKYLAAVEMYAAHHGIDRVIQACLCLLKSVAKHRFVCIVENEACQRNVIWPDRDEYVYCFSASMHCAV